MASRKLGAARASRVGALGFTALALVLTGLTAVLLAKLMGGQSYEQISTVDVVVAARNIAPGEQITDDHVKVVKWPQETAPEKAYNALDEILGPDPRVPSAAILEGEPILPQRLAAQEQGTGMASLVPAEFRGFPVPVERWFADARMVYPGATVDVLSTIRDPDTRKASSRMILQNIRVLAVDGHVDVVSSAADEEERKKQKSGGNRSVVTLLVRPPEAEMLALASREGRIDLVLRNARDEEEVETMGIFPEAILPDPPPELEAEEPQAKRRARPRLRRPARRPSKSSGSTGQFRFGGR